MKLMGLKALLMPDLQNKLNFELEFCDDYERVRAWVNARVRQGRLDSVSVLLFSLQKAFNPGGVEEEINLHNQILNPNGLLQCENGTY